mmetsp:Transcript_150097/g.418195  ORF Transcript_150097/g.418195 Transcript_150097/m.418195 type:complete len:227 (-) Transcript_150097:319-999(-)
MDPLLDLHQRCLIHQVALVQKDSVSKCDLLNGLVLHSIGLFLVKVRNDVLGVHHGEDAVQGHVFLHKVVREEGLGHRRRVRQASCLDQHSVQELAGLRHVLDHLLEAGDQVAAHGAADAAVVHLHDVLLGRQGAGFEELVVDADLAKLVLDDSYALPMVLLQDPVQQGCLAAPEEPRNDRDRHLVGLHPRIYRGLFGLGPLRAEARVLAAEPLCTGIVHSRTLVSP